MSDQTENEKPRRGGSKKGPPKTKEKASAKRKPWTFPQKNLEDAIRVAQAIEEKNAGNPMRASDLAVAVGFRQANDWRFLDLLRSANQYGLVTGTPSSPIALTKLGQDIVVPSSPSQRSKALLDAFRTVKDFAEVEKFYQGKSIPEDEFFLNTLVRDFNIPRDRVETFAKVFQENLKYIKAFTPAEIAANKETVPGSAPRTFSSSIFKNLLSLTGSQPEVRKFLDTCFVMMPFGEWFDRYYQEIYVPAIKEAGFEPVRADELFTTGSVVEQIWEQIEKAKMLLADLSGKNANVFYELGLAHAARKPVVFTSSNTEDVPFDLRHLRVIIYDIREPEWANRLRSDVTEHLRNAAKDAAKSIPHPFRRYIEEAEPEELTSRPSRKGA
jgi:hypothetical protein